MDAIRQWSPAIDWSRFAQGDISDPMWHGFRGLVVLCHEVKYRGETSRSLRLTKPFRPLDPESPAMKKKRLDQWKQPIKDSDAKMHRAAYLASAKLAEMRGLIVDKGEPDSKLWRAAVLSIEPSRRYNHARYKSVALEAFDAAELNYSDPRAVADRWLDNAGYPNQGLQL